MRRRGPPVDLGTTTRGQPERRQPHARERGRRAPVIFLPPALDVGFLRPRWESLLLPRVDGQFTGTTDEILQWAACKWGLSDNLIRADAFEESTWFEASTYSNGQCVTEYGCGDFFSSSSTSSATYCNGVAALGGVDYQRWDGAGLCPQTFSILGVMSWWDPAWGFNWAGNQNGTFPLSHQSTAFAADYWGAMIRGCYEGWQWELGGSGHVPGDLWGCMGAWFSGGWHDSPAGSVHPRGPGGCEFRTVAGE